VNINQFKNKPGKSDMKQQVEIVVKKKTSKSKKKKASKKKDIKKEEEEKCFVFGKEQQVDITEETKEAFKSCEKEG